ncbi:MAG: Sec-independent protein translocase protein TatB [Micrococcales bacterium]|nr:Sec-independent protein translocase protein TatB [Micrococcales bacterium]
MFDINGWELLILGVLAILVLGPERLPDYAAKFGRFVRQARTMAERAKAQLKDEMGPEFSDIDWQAYDPRQYDPRRIVREALNSADDDDPDGRPDHADSADAADKTVKAQSAPAGHDPLLATPWDPEAT